MGQVCCKSRKGGSHSSSTAPIIDPNMFNAPVEYNPLLDGMTAVDPQKLELFQRHLKENEPEPEKKFEKEDGVIDFDLFVKINFLTTLYNFPLFYKR